MSSARMALRPRDWAGAAAAAARTNTAANPAIFMNFTDLARFKGSPLARRTERPRDTAPPASGYFLPASSSARLIFSRKASFGSYPVPRRSMISVPSGFSKISVGTPLAPYFL